MNRVPIRIPKRQFGGRVSTSTVLIALAFVVTLWVYLTVRDTPPDPADAPRGPQVVTVTPAVPEPSEHTLPTPATPTPTDGPTAGTPTPRAAPAA